MSDPASSETARWWPVATSVELADAGHFLAVRLFDRPWLVTALDRELTAVRDECPHRRVPLSAGHRVDTPAGEQLECRYHGWRFAGSGACALVPALGPTAGVPKGMRVQTARLTERYGMVWLAAASPATATPQVAGVAADNVPACARPQRWAMPALELLVRIQRSIGGTLASDGASLRVRPSRDDGEPPVTLLVQPETAVSSRLFSLRHTADPDHSVEQAYA